MNYQTERKSLKRILMLLALLFIVAVAGLHVGYRRGYQHAEKITNKWWIDQQSQYFDATEIEKKRRALHYDAV